MLRADGETAEEVGWRRWAWQGQDMWGWWRWSNGMWVWRSSRPEGEVEIGVGDWRVMGFNWRYWWWQWVEVPSTGGEMVRTWTRGPAAGQGDWWAAVVLDWGD